MNAPIEEPRSMTTHPATLSDLPDGACLETPSGKGAGDENFPVGSFLIRADLRPHVHAFYQFARMADDVVDNPDLTPDEKIIRLTRLGDILRGNISENPAKILSPAAWRLRQSLDRTGVSPQHGLDLLTAFIQDARKARYADWDDLIGYCLYSAAPVGRYVLDLHEIGAACRPASDALCNALQIINHIQDCGKDYLALDRVYVPTRLLDDAGASIEDLGLPALTPPLRAVIDQLIPGTEALLAASASLITDIDDPWLALECHVIHRLATRLTDRLKREDPLATRVVFPKSEAARIAVSALAQGAFRRFVHPRRPAPSPDTAPMSPS